MSRPEFGIDLVSSFASDAILYLLNGLAVWIFWNLLIPSIFELPTIRYGHALGMIVLVNALTRPIATHTTESINKRRKANLTTTP